MIDVICIGTMRCVRDSIGPMVGTELLRRGVDESVKVIGTVDNPVHGGNYHDRLKELRVGAFVIAVDAYTTKTKSDIGTIEVRNGPMRPGAGLGKSLPPVGNICIGCYTATSQLQLVYDVVFPERDQLVAEVTTEVERLIALQK